MIYIVDKKRRLVVYAINIIGLIAYPFYFLFKGKWKNKRNDILNRLRTKEIRSITINCTDRLGDIILSLPTLKALKKSFPWIKVIVITNKNGSEIFSCNPHVDETITVDNFWVGKSIVSLREFIKSFSGEYFRKIREIRNKQIDLLIEVKGDFRNILFFDIWAGAQYLIGYSLSGFGWMLDWEMAYNPSLHEIDAKLNIAKLLGADIRDRKMEFYLSDEDRLFADVFLRSNRIGEKDLVAVFHVGGTWEPKMWPLGKFIEIGKRLDKEYKARIILIGDKREEKKIAEFRKSISGALRLDNASVSEVAAVIKRAAIYVGNDSGPLHLARSVKTPLIGIFGTGNVRRVGPEEYGIAFCRDMPCAPCGQVACEQHPNCVELISVDEVWQAVKNILEKGRSVR